MRRHILAAPRRVWVPAARLFARGMSRFDKKRKQRGALELEPPDEPAFATSGGRRMHRFLSENVTLLLVGLVLFAFVCLPLFVVDDFFFVKTAEPERASGQKAAVLRKELARPARHELFGHDPHAHMRAASNLTAAGGGAARPARPALESGADASAAAAKKEAARAWAGLDAASPTLAAPPAAPAADAEPEIEAAPTAGDAPMATESAPVDEVESASAVDVAVESAPADETDGSTELASETEAEPEPTLPAEPSDMTAELETDAEAEDGAFTPPPPPPETFEVSDGAGDGEATAEAVPEDESRVRRRARGVDEATEPALDVASPEPVASPDARADEHARRRRVRGRR